MTAKQGIEDAQRTADGLRTHNQKLKQLRAELPKIAAPSLPRREDFIALPDLNDPLLDC